MLSAQAMLKRYAFCPNFMKHSIIERENYNKSKSENAKQPQCPKEKEEAIEEALKHFRML